VPPARARSSNRVADLSSSLLNLGSYLLIVPILGILILVHEFGHFITARMCGVKVEEFGIGIPPRLKGWTWKGVLWSLNILPVGGFVRVKGEDGANMDPDSMNSQPPHERAFFLSAGAGMNILLAVVLIILTTTVQGGETHTNTYIAGVVPGSPAAKAGWQSGDRVVRVEGDKVTSTEQISHATKANAGDALTVTIERRGSLIDTTVVPRKHPPKGEGAVGVYLDTRTALDVYADQVQPGSAAATAGLQNGDRIVTVNHRPVNDLYVLTTELNRFTGFDVPISYERAGQTHEATLAVPKPQTGQDVTLAAGLSKIGVDVDYNPVPALKIVPNGIARAYDTTKQMIVGIVDLFSSRENLGQVAGPVGMAQLTSEIVERSNPTPVWARIADLMILLSLNLAVLNLLPLPALDGGRLFFVLVEVLRGGRRISPEKEGLVHFAGLVLLLALMFVIAFNDIKRIFEGKSFLP
jgi:regulator of sigma E protease